MPGIDLAFRSVFPSAVFTTPTPQSTPNIGAVASPQLPSRGSESFNEAFDDDVKLSWAWRDATSCLTLSENITGKPVTTSGDGLAAINYVLGSYDGRTQLEAWYKHEISSHFRTFVLPELHVWQKPIALNDSPKVLNSTLSLLLKAQRHYCDKIKTLSSEFQAVNTSKTLQFFNMNIQWSTRALFLHALPKHRLSETLAIALAAYMWNSLITLRTGQCSTSNHCHCMLDLGDAPLQELHDLGIGSHVGERAFAHALHILLESVAHSMSCFQVDWTSHRSVVPKLRAWIHHYVLPAVEGALFQLRGFKSGTEYDGKTPPLDAGQLSSIAIRYLGANRVGSLFDYIKVWPESTGAILDIWEYLNAGTQADKLYVCNTFSEQIDNRLLHVGASTVEILSIYVNVIHTFKALDGRGVMLEKVAAPIRNYLKARDDTASIIASSFLADVDENGNVGPNNSDKVCPDIAMAVSNATLGGRGEEQSLNWDDMDWTPDPIDAGPHYRSSKSEDVIAQIIGLFDPQQFIKELTTVLAQHLLQSTDLEYIKETRLLELLHSRLDKALLQTPDVMLKDMRNSVMIGKRINPPTMPVPTPREIQAAIPEEGITVASLYSMFEKRMKQPQFYAAVKLVANKRNGLLYPKRSKNPPNLGESSRSQDAASQDSTQFDVKILSGFFWPELRSNEFSMPRSVQPLQAHFKERFYALGSQRKLELRPALARVSIRLQLEDRVVEETDVAGWRASVIDAFTDAEEYDNDHGLSVDDLKERVMMDEELVQDALQFWVNKNILYQNSSGLFAVLERLDMDIGAAQQPTAQHEDVLSAVKSQDAMLREGAPMFETFIANMLRNHGAKQVSGPMGITFLLKMVLPTFTYGDEEVIWLLGEMERKGVVRKDEGSGAWSVLM